MLLARRLLAGTIAAAAVSALTALPAAASVQRPTGRTALAGRPVCLDASNDRVNGTQVYLLQCLRNTNQRFVIDNGLIKVEDTIGTGRQEMCLDASNDRVNGTRVYLFQCLGNTNQIWVIKRGELIIKDSIASGRPVCLDASNDRANGTPVYLFQCLGNTNQKFVIDDSLIKVKDTLS
jgi:hypothetical protein